MPSRKRSLQEADSAHSEQAKDQSLVHRLRNSFYFANLYQWICIFGKVVKIDDNLDIAVCPPPQILEAASKQQAASSMVGTNCSFSTGSRDRMSEAWLHGVAGHWLVHAEAYFLAPRIDVSCSSHRFASAKVSLFHQT